VEGPPERGLTWLIGTDANSAALPAREAAQLARMHEIRTKRLVIM